MPFKGPIPINCSGVVFVQIVWFALIDPTINGGFIDMMTVLEEAGFPVVQLALEVIIQVMVLLVAGINE